MLKLKLDGKELNVKYGFEATLKTKLLSKMAKNEVSGEGTDGGEMDKIENLLLFLPELLLVGLQKFHKDEYCFDYANGKGKDEQIEKVFSLIEEYFDVNPEEDAITLYSALTEEMLQNGFLKSQFQEELKKATTQKK